jgi:dihydroorotate dehydrogenase electron transfer subunit
MTAPGEGACFADTALHQTVEVVENVRLARDTWRLRLDCPAIATRIVPGQFIMVRLPGADDPLLGRPLALYDTVLDDAGRPCGIDVVYLIVGRVTGLLSRLRVRDQVEIWGPLGNGFAPRTVEHLVMVAGGIGQTPFLALAREHLGRRRYGTPVRSGANVERVTLCYGARSQDLLAGVADFTSVGVKVSISTDDGNQGHHGLVTDLLEQVLESDLPARRGLHVVCCGPEKMMAAVASRCREAGVSCEVSLETPMACGIGVCFSCVARVREGDGWDYRRTCVEGPVFDAARLVW